MSIPEEVPRGTKVCPTCCVDKPTSAFSKNRRRIDGLSYYCRPCASDRHKASYARNVTEIRARDRARHCTPERRARHLVRMAAQRRPCTLDVAAIRDVIEHGRCQVTGIPFALDMVEGMLRNPFAPSVDRIDPGLDYTPENTQVVILAYNWAKNQMDDTEARALIKRMAEAL